jgi:hypothetical protein
VPPLRTHAPAGFVGHAPQAVAQGLTRGAAAMARLVNGIPEVLGEGASQRSHVLGHLAEFVIPGHETRLRVRAGGVINPWME